MGIRFERIKGSVLEVLLTFSNIRFLLGILIGLSVSHWLLFEAISKFDFTWYEGRCVASVSENHE